MRAFDEAIERIEEINIPNELIPVFVKTMQRMSSYFDSIGDLRLDFDKLFHNRLYNNLKFVLVDEIVDASGTYNTFTNTITLIKANRYDDFAVHIMTHEFIHFIIHNSYKNLPTWADEMMTEKVAREISQADYGAYMSLVNEIGYFINDRIEKISTKQFLNGEFQSFIDKYKLNEITQDLDHCTQSSWVSSSVTIPIIYFLVNIKIKEYLQESMSYDQLLNNFVHLICQGKGFVGGSETAVFYFSQVTSKYITEKAKLSNFKLNDEINHSLQILLMQKYFENNIKESVDYIQRFGVGKVEHYLAYIKDKVYMLANANGEKLSYFSEIKHSRKYILKFTSISSAYFKEQGDGDCIEINGENFFYDKKLRKYNIPNATIYDCRHNGLLKDLNNKINETIYKNACKNIQLKNISTCRIASDDIYILQMLNHINEYVKNSQVELYCTEPHKFTTGASLENGLVYVSPIYYVSPSLIEKSQKIKFNLNKDILDTLVDCLSGGEQINIFAKKQDGGVFPIINLVKEFKDDYQISFAYDSLMRELPKSYQDIIYQKFVPKQDNNLILNN